MMNPNNKLKDIFHNILNSFIAIKICLKVNKFTTLRL